MKEKHFQSFPRKAIVCSVLWAKDAFSDKSSKSFLLAWMEIESACTVW